MTEITPYTSEPGSELLHFDFKGLSLFSGAKQNETC